MTLAKLLSALEAAGWQRAGREEGDHVLTRGDWRIRVGFDGEAYVLREQGNQWVLDTFDWALGKVRV